MNKIYSFYDPDTGLIAEPRFTGPERMLAANTPAGLVAIEGHFDRLSQRIDLPTGMVVAYQPPDSALAMRRAMAARQRLEILERQKIRPMSEVVLDPTNAEARTRLAAIEAEMVSLRADVAAVLPIRP